VAQLLRSAGAVGPYVAAAAQSTWTDPATKLMWAAESNTSKVNCNQAKIYCANLRLAGYSDWRLATIDELAAIYDEKTQDIDDCHIKGGIVLKNDDCLIWSSSAGSKEGEASRFFFGGGWADDMSVGGSRAGEWALCVRPSGK